MGDLKTQNTSYPASKDTATLFADLTDFIVAQNQNGPNTAIVAIENELGIGLKGSVADLATRLGINIGTDGGIVKATADPASPGTPAFYYNTVTNKLKIFNISTGQWDEFTTAAGLASYVRTDVPNTIPAVHTFSATTVPFIVSSAAVTTVTNLDADKVDGQNRVLTINADHTHTATGAMGGVIDHASLDNKGTNTHAQIDTFISSKAQASGIASLDGSSKVVQEPASKAQASGIASLDGSSKVVQDPANAVTTFTANKLPLRDANGIIGGGVGIVSEVIGTSTSTTTVSLSMGNVNVGDIIHVQGTVEHSLSGTGFTNGFWINQNTVAYRISGSATLTAEEGWSSLVGTSLSVYSHDSTYKPSSPYLFYGHVCGVMVVTGSGDLTIGVATNGASALGANITYTVTNIRAAAYFIKKQ
jgi:hypothetical protein